MQDMRLDPGFGFGFENLIFPPGRRLNIQPTCGAYRMWLMHGLLCVFLLLPVVVLANDKPRQLAHDADIYLVPVGPVPERLMQTLAQRYRDILRLKVEITAPLPLPDNTVDPQRKQLVAENTHALMARVFEQWKWNPSAVVVGVTSYDMYIAAMNWRFAYAYGQGKYALVSAARMSDAESTDSNWSDHLTIRVRKMLDKRIAIQLFGFGSTAPMPAILAMPVLGPDDLDRIGADELTRLLSDAARSSGDFDAPILSTVADNVADLNPNSRTSWVAVLAFAIGALLISVLIYKVARRSERTSLEKWRTYAQGRGWRFTQRKYSWLSSIPFSLEGEIDGTPFTMHWYQVGSGKNIRQKTHLWLDIAVPEPLAITPLSGLFSGIVKRDRLRTGDRLYDCHYLIQPADVNWTPTAAMRRRHLAAPATVLAQEDGLHLIHTGNADRQETERLVDLARSWIAHLAGKVDSSSVLTGSGASAASCWLGKSAELMFWIYTLCSALLLFFITGEETNLPWEIALEWLLPAALTAWIAWILWRIVWQRQRAHFLQQIVVSAFVIAFVLILSGPWVIAWNALTGSPTGNLVIGPVVDLYENSSRRGGPRYFVEFRDLDEQRAVKIQTDSETYERLRVGDPVGFEMHKGGLGMYYSATPTLNAVRSWLNSRGWLNSHE